jgi:nucleoside-diphosphate-sugar epimerase
MENTVNTATAVGVTSPQPASGNVPIGPDGRLVLVTGGSGFIAGYCILQLLKAGYRVRTTVRSLSREAEVRATLKGAGPEGVGEAVLAGALTFVAADLLSDAGWPEAVKGCDFVLHVASPFPPGVPKHEDELIVPARDGALRVLRAARDAGVKRVVLTSSFAAIGYGHAQKDRPFTEENWSDLNGRGLTAYAKSKTIAERAAWDFMTREGGALELSVVNPVGVFGPLLGPDISASIQLILRLMNGSMPGCPRLSFGIVDVRDIADLHLRAMTNPAAKGERFLGISGDFMTIQEMAFVLRARMGAAAKKVPTRMLPDWLLRSFAIFDPTIAQITPELGKSKNASNDKARRILGWNPRPKEDAIFETAKSLVKLGLLEKKV